MTKRSEIVLDNPLYRLVAGRHGNFLVNPHDTYIGKALLTYGEFSELEWQVIDQLTPPGGFVVEIGANIGAHTVSLAKKAGWVTAYEPQPVIFQNLCANLALNGLTNVHAVNAGCGEHAEEIAMPRIDYSREGNFGAVSLDSLPVDEGAWVRVPVVRLDDGLTAPALHLLKIDAEGMEAAILRGAGETIARFRPTIYLENDRPDKSRELIALLFELDYAAWWHLPPYFNPDNRFGVAENRYGQTVSANMICLPKERKVSIDGFAQVGSVDEHPIGWWTGGFKLNIGKERI